MMKETAESINTATASIIEAQQNLQSSVTAAKRAVLKGKRIRNPYDDGTADASARRPGPKSPATLYLHVWFIFLTPLRQRELILI